MLGTGKKEPQEKLLFSDPRNKVLESEGELSFFFLFFPPPFPLHSLLASRQYHQGSAVVGAEPVLAAEL